MYRNGWGELLRDDTAGTWETTALLPAFANYGQNLVRSNPPGAEPGLQTFEEHSDRRAELFAEGRFKILALDPEGDGPSPCQEEAYQFLTEHEDRVGKAAIKALFADYQQHRDERWGDREPYWPEDELDAALPELESAEGLLNLIRLRRVEIEDPEGEQPACLRLLFECAWDPDHDLAVRMRRDRVLGVDEEGIAPRETLLPAA